MPYYTTTAEFNLKVHMKTSQRSSLAGHSQTHTRTHTSIHFTHALSFLIARERFFVIDVESWLLPSFSNPVFFGNVELKVKWRKVLHLCEIWNIISKYIKAQCLINVFRIQIGRCILLSFFLSDHAVNKCMFFSDFFSLWSRAFCTETEK